MVGKLSTRPGPSHKSEHEQTRRGRKVCTRARACSIDAPMWRGGTSFGYWDSSLMHAPRSTDVTSISSTCGARRRPSRARSLAPGRIGPETGQGPRGPRAAATERMGLCRRRKAPPAVRPNRTYFLRFSYVSRPPFRKNRFFVRAPIIASGSTLHQSRSPAVRPWGAGGPPRRRA